MMDSVNLTPRTQAFKAMRYIKPGKGISQWEPSETGKAVCTLYHEIAGKFPLSSYYVGVIDGQTAMKLEGVGVLETTPPKLDYGDLAIGFPDEALPVVEQTAERLGIKEQLLTESAYNANRGVITTENYDVEELLKSIEEKPVN